LGDFFFVMPRPYFIQECPVCGRPLEILVAYLGRRVTCEHCHGKFVAADPATGPRRELHTGHLLERAEALLAASDQRAGVFH
jgi:hypothetical protein